MIHLYYTYSVSKLPYRRAFISATSNREFPPDFLNQRWHTLPDGTKIQRDLYSGFLICYTNDKLDHVDRKVCIHNFKQFKELHDQEIVHLKRLDNPDLRWYIA